jgi:pimeloyl-ACP methyl ester carboxylesterase
VRLHYDVEGDGSPVLLLHGFAADTERNWRAPGIIAALVAAGHRVVGLDARGHGASEKRYDPRAYAGGAMVQDAGALLDHLRIAEADVAGYSMGSATAIRFALAGGRVRRLVLGGTGGNLDVTAEALEERGQRIADALEASDPERIEDPDARRFRRFAELTGADLRALAAVQRGRRQTPLSRDEVATIAVETLVICGDQDVSPDELASLLPLGRSVVIAGDHLSAVRNPALATEIVRFLDD